MFKRLLFSIFWSLLLISCGNSNRKSEQTALSAEVFYPGSDGKKALFSLLNSGVKKAAGKAGISVKKIKGDLEESFWESELLQLASFGENTLIVSMGQRFAEVGNKVGESYPKQDILVLNAVSESNRITTVSFNQFEQAFILGYCAALISLDKKASTPLKVGLVAYQGTPQLNAKIRRGFQIGIETVEPDAQLELRLLKNQDDKDEAEKAAVALYESGVKVILTLPGKQNKGVSAAARSAKSYVLLMNATKPVSFLQKTVLANTIIHQEKAAEFWTNHWISGNLEKGVSFQLGVSDSMIDFSLSRWKVSKDIQNQMAVLMKHIKNGSLVLSNSKSHEF